MLTGRNAEFEVAFAEHADFMNAREELEKKSIRAKYKSKDPFGQRILPGDKIANFRGSWVLVDEASPQRQAEHINQMRRMSK